jgi:uncharacterized phage-associated protein
MCRVRKLAQMAAYFLQQNGGGPMEHVKLMKLMYLADREAIDVYGFPISDDEYYSMKMGPVLSLTLDLMSDNEGPETQSEWSEWVSAKENHQVRPQKEITNGDLDEIVEEEIAVMKKVFDQFGGYTMRELVEYTHNELGEWEELDRGRSPINLRTIFEKLGKPEPEIEAKIRCLESVKPNTASPRPVATDVLIMRVRKFHSLPISYPTAYADKIDAILNAQ